MENNDIIKLLKKSDLTKFDNVSMLFDMAVNTADMALNDFVFERCVKNIGKGLSEFYDIYRRSLLFAAPRDFDKYMIYIELERQPEERFYLPRRKILKQVVDELQKLADDELDELFISCPPRVGKTSLLMFFVTWLLGRNSESTNLYSAYSDVITSAFYRGVLEVINDNMTYLWRDVFPCSSIVATNAADETINLDRKKRYPSLTCRSLYGTLNGACDCKGMLISDDLIGGIEEALNRDRMMSAWSKVENNLVTRAKETAKILWCGTRWSNNDPAGLRMDLVLNSDKFSNRRIKIINLPALDKNDESNFDYDFNVGFTTDFYRQRRASFERNNDMASWSAQYMGEPIEREGALFVPDDMVFFNGELPPGEPERIFMAVDPAFGGGDFVAAPVCYQFDGALYIPDVVFSNAEKETTQPLITEMIIKHNIQAIEFECTKSTVSYKEGVEKLLKEKDYKCAITHKAAPNNTTKEIRIFDHSGEIREMRFVEEGKRSRAYSMFMQNVFAFKMAGKNKHDDAPDSLVMLCEMRKGGKKVTVLPRFF